MVEQVADAADDKLDRAGRKHIGLDHHPEGGFAQIGGRASGLDDCRDPREQRRGKLLEHPPHREIIGVDVDRGALQRRVDVLTHEGAGLRQILQRPIEQDVPVGQVAATFGGE